MTGCVLLIAGTLLTCGTGWYLRGKAVRRPRAVLAVFMIGLTALLLSAILVALSAGSAAAAEGAGSHATEVAPARQISRSASR